MNPLYKISSFILLLIFFQSCEKVIDIDLKETPSQIVIEAPLQAGTNDFTVTIQKTTVYFDGEPQATIQDAVITLTDDSGNLTAIPSIGNGQYQTEITAEVGRTYTLVVETEGNTYEATSFLPEKIELVDLVTEFEEGIFGDESGFEILLRYNDPPDVSNYYRIVHSLNGIIQKEAEDLQVMTDDFNDGVLTKTPLLTDTFQEDDTVEIELIHFDRNSYDYFNSLISIAGEGDGFGGGIAAPGNPNSNWSNGALGYFSAYNSDKQTIVIQ